MKNETGQFQGVGGLSMFTQWWLPDTPPKAVMAICHGIGEHCGRYPNLVGPLTEAGFAVYGYDLRGHGRSGGQRGHINRWSDYRQDLQLFLDFVHSHQRTAPIFLYAHSLGSLIALDYIMRPADAAQPGGMKKEDLKGVIISGCAVEPVGVASPALILVAKTLSSIWPTFTVTLGLNTAGLSRDKDVVSAYENDPLVHGKTTTRWGAESLATVDWIKANPQAVNQPILFVHGGDDPLNSCAGARRFYDQVPAADKAFYVYPASLHEPHNDLDHKQVARDIQTWMDKHLEGSVVEPD